MIHALVLLMALLLGVVAGLRALTAAAVVAWAAFLGWIDLHFTWAFWMGNISTVAIVSVLAVAELVTDKLPTTPPRTTGPSFSGRMMMGAFAGAVLGAAWHYTFSALACGLIGAVFGTVGGYQARRRLAAARDGQDLPVALLEDTLAVLGGFAIMALTASL